MSKQFDDENIVKLYQQNNSDLPPKAIDDAILARAFDATKFDATKTQEQPVTLKPNRWWQYSGIAAAVVAIAVFAPWQYYQEPDFESDLQSLEAADKLVKPHAKQTAKKEAKREPQKEAMELLAEEVQLEKIEVTGSRIERAAPEQKARTVQASPSAIFNSKGVELLSEFKVVLAKLEENDNNGAEQTLIQLLEAKPDLHDKIPEPLEGLYQTLLENGKLTKPD